MDKESFFNDLRKKNITHFDFDDEIEIDGYDLPLLAKYCPLLESIELPMEVGYEELKYLHHLPRLTSLSIENGLCLCDRSLSVICSLPKIRSLTLNNLHFGRDFIRDLSGGRRANPGCRRTGFKQCDTGAGSGQSSFC